MPDPSTLAAATNRDTPVVDPAAVLDALPAPVLVVAADGRIERANASARDRLGDVGIAPGAAIDDVFGFDGPDGVSGFAGLAAQCAVGGRPARVSTVLVRARDGHRLDADVTRVPGGFVVTVTATGAHPAGTTFAGTSLEAQLKTFFEHVPAYTRLKDLEGRYTLWNSRNDEVFGTPGQGMLGRTVYDTVLPEEAARRVADAERLAIAEDSTVTYEVVAPSDPSRTIRSAVFPVRDETGTIVGTGAIGFDVSDFKRLERQYRAAYSELARAHRALRHHVEHTPLAVMEFDREHRIVSWSPRCTELFGYTAGEVLGRMPSEFALIHPDDLEFVVSKFPVAGVGERDFWRLNNRNLHKDGRVLHVEWFNSMLRGDEGEFVGLLSLAIDRTEEVTARRALEASEARYALAIAASRDAVFDLDFRTGELGPSPRFIEMLGIDSVDDLPPLAELPRRLFVPEDRSLVRRALAAHFLHGEPISFEARLERPGGDPLWVNVRADSKRDATGRVSRMFGSFRDISERKRTEQELAAALERLEHHLANSLMGVVEVDESGTVLAWSETAQRILGWRADELVGRPATVFVHPDDLALIEPYFERFADPTFQSWNLVNRNLHRDGHVKTCEWYSTVIRDDDGRMVSNLAFFIDRTAEADALAELRRSNLELEQFAYLASHDLQEPLRMVANYSELVARDYGDRLDDEGRAFLGYAIDGAQRMRQLIHDLLDYSRAGSAPLSRRTVDAGAVVDAVAATFRAELADGGGRITRDSLPSLLTDESQLALMFQNLVGNGLKYRSDAPPAVHVSCRPIHGGYAFGVRDNGIGIEPEYRERIFDMFQRLHPRRRYPGTGIGLAICRRVAERLGGRIWVESTPGCGSTFWFEVPAATPE